MVLCYGLGVESSVLLYRGHTTSLAATAQLCVVLSLAAQLRVALLLHTTLMCVALWLHAAQLCVDLSLAARCSAMCRSMAARSLLSVRISCYAVGRC